MLSIYRDDIKEEVATVALETAGVGLRRTKSISIRATHGSPKLPLCAALAWQTRFGRMDLARGHSVQAAHEGAASEVSEVIEAVRQTATITDGS